MKIAGKIGKTPLIELQKLKASLSLKGNIFAKAEWYNPGGSVKDRAALFMIEGAEKRGDLQAGGVIVEATSGNTGIGLALAGREKGYRTLIVMPETMSHERRRILCEYGAELILTEGKAGMAGAVAKAKEICAEIPGAWLASQFENTDNAHAHYSTTAPEVFDALDGNIATFVSGVGTGGTISGCGRFFIDRGLKVKITAVEPSESPVLSGGAPSPHRIQGIGAGFVPKLLDTHVIDNIVKVSTHQAFECAGLLRDTEGLEVGISAAAALCAAIEEAKKNAGNVVVVFPDNADKYRSVEGYLK